MVHQPTAAIDRCGKRAAVLVAIGLREASVPEGMVAMHGISLTGGGGGACGQGVYWDHP